LQLLDDAGVLASKLTTLSIDPHMKLVANAGDTLLDHQCTED